jgi:hypothetical protein
MNPHPYILLHPILIPKPPTRNYYRDEKKSGDSHFPGVTELARRVLPCPPSTGPVERIFSVCGQVESGKKYRLGDVSMTMLTMLRETWDIV